MMGHCGGGAEVTCAEDDDEIMQQVSEPHHSHLTNGVCESIAHVPLMTPVHTEQLAAQRSVVRLLCPYYRGFRMMKGSQQSAGKMFVSCRLLRPPRAFI